MKPQNKFYLFQCSVSEELYGASLNSNGSPLPTPAGGDWLAIKERDLIDRICKNFDPQAAQQDIDQWGCHWFTSKGPREIYWGPSGPPKSPSLTKQTILEFESTFKGELILKSDPNYNVARTVWNKSIDKYPFIIARCKGVSDVINAVKFSKENDLTVAVRGGGHSVAGYSTCNGGIVIDLGMMNAVQVNPNNCTATVEGGATIADVDRETQPFGLAVPLGVVSETGIAGLTLCGGHSWLTRLHGFACDNLISANLITADGKFVTANKSQNQELFWAIRGGGGNFGIIVSFQFNAHPIGKTVTFCAPFFPIEDAAAILRAWRDYMQQAPDQFTSNCMLWSIPHDDAFPKELQGREVIIPCGVYTGNEQDALKFIQPIRQFATALLDLSGPIAYESVQQAFDAHFSSKNKRYNYWKSLYLDQLSDQTIDKIVAQANNRPDPWTLIPIRHMGGKAAKVSPSETALGGRDANFMLSIDSSWSNKDQSETAIEWTQTFWKDIQQGTKGSAYLNFLGEEDDHENLMKASYGQKNYQRLKKVKSKYDPENLFALNQNIQPYK